MALFKCKMCGGSLEVLPGATVIECEYCGTQQTLPKLDDDRRANLYDRANHFRRNNEFDKAMGIYEQILNEDTADAEAYWSLVLCRYGIEYVEDPSSHKRIPTVNRAQFTSVFDDDNYKSARKYADSLQKSVYEAEAKAINEIQKGILAISQKEEPFDVFICYKETDANGRRTPDSVLANDLYHQLTQEGFKVFFARITLEDKLGSAYEPYIFAALNSAKVMVALGTKPEYFKAVWVKNEWSRYLSLIKQGQKKILIPAYRDMDPYDLPDEFSHLQAQDMSKLGFMQDLVRGIKKITQSTDRISEKGQNTEPAGSSTNTSPLIKRIFMFLEDENWASADEYCEKVLDIDPESAEAYLGKLMADLHAKTQEELKNCERPFDGDNNYKKMMRFADNGLKETISGYIDHIYAQIEEARLSEIYDRASNIMYSSSSRNNRYSEAAEIFESILQYRDSGEMAEKCRQYAEESRKDAILSEATLLLRAKNSAYLSVYDRIRKVERAANMLESLSDWKDADKELRACKDAIVLLNAEREETEREAKRSKTIKSILVPVLVVSLIVLFILICSSVNRSNSRKAERIYANFAGRSFTCSYKSYESGSYSPVEMFGSIDSVTDYTVTYRFQNSGTVDKTTLAKSYKNPYRVVDGQIQYDNIDTYSDTVGSYSVDVSFFGKVTVFVGRQSFEVKCDSANRPTSISDGMHTYSP